MARKTINQQNSLARSFGAIPIFAGLSDPMRSEILARATSVRVPAGDWLFRQGDPAESLYVVRSGRLEIIAEGPKPWVVRVLTQGAAVGELALLTQTARSASARARRDTELLELRREHFYELLRAEPEFAIALSRALGSQLRASRALAEEQPSLTTTITVLPLEEGLPVEEVGALLETTLRRWGPVILLGDRSPGQDDAYGELLDRAERDHDRVLLLVRSPSKDDSWTRFCLRQADRTLVLARSEYPPEDVGRHPELRGCDLLLLAPGSRPGPVAPWVDALEPRVVHAVNEGGDFESGVVRVARRVAGRSIGVVLSGGGARGFAHIGVLEELRAGGIEIDRVGGCSMGAFVGAMFALGLSAEEMRACCRRELIERSPLRDYTVPIVALIRGRKAREMLVRTFGSAMIEDLPCEYFCVSCDLVTGELVVHRRGALFEAVGASMCLPGVAAPLARGGRLLVDGGVRSNLPVESMRATGEGPLIAVDVTGHFLPPDSHARHSIRQGSGPWAQRIRKLVVGVEEPLPSIKEILIRAIGMGSVEAIDNARQEADLLIEPKTGVVDLLAFDRLDHMVELGRQAARAALSRARELQET